MLEETRDTITVPASFMIRMVACLNQIRRGMYVFGSVSVFIVRQNLACKQMKILENHYIKIIFSLRWPH